MLQLYVVVLQCIQYTTSKHSGIIYLMLDVYTLLQIACKQPFLGQEGLNHLWLRLKHYTHAHTHTHTHTHTLTLIIHNCRDIRGTLVNRSSDRSCTGGMIHNKIHPIKPRLSSAHYSLTAQNRGLKHHSFIHLFTHYTWLLTSSLAVSYDYPCETLHITIDWDNNKKIYRAAFTVVH